MAELHHLALLGSYAIEQASRRWRGGRRDDSARTRRKILISTQVDDRLSRIAGGVSLFVNAQRSWACVRRRQHCFRNLDVDYLTIKAFLLERFLHDALYEAPTAEVFNEFLDIRPAPAAQVSFASSPSLPRSAVSGSLSR